MIFLLPMMIVIQNEIRELKLYLAHIDVTTYSAAEVCKLSIRS